MEKFNTDIDLLKLKGAVVKNIKGKQATKMCIIIPIEDADLYAHVNGDLEVDRVKLNLAHFKRNEVGQYGDTHLVKQSHGKFWNESHSDEDKKNEPILGSSKPMESKQPQAQVQTLEMNDDNLPF